MKYRHDSKDTVAVAVAVAVAVVVIGRRRCDPR